MNKTINKALSGVLFVFVSGGYRRMLLRSIFILFVNQNVDKVCILILPCIARQWRQSRLQSQFNTNYVKIFDFDCRLKGDIKGAVKKLSQHF